MNKFKNILKQVLKGIFILIIIGVSIITIIIASVDFDDFPSDFDIDNPEMTE